MIGDLLRREETQTQGRRLCKRCRSYSDASTSQPSPVFLPGESHGQRSLAGYNPWGCKELGMTEATEYMHICIERERQRKKLPCFFSSCSVTYLCPTLCDPVDCSTPGFPVLHRLPEFTQTHVHWVGDAIQPSHPLSPPSPPALNLSQHQGLFQWVGSSHQVAKVLELQFQHQSFQWIFRVDFHY